MTTHAEIVEKLKQSALGREIMAGGMAMWDEGVEAGVELALAAIAEVAAAVPADQREGLEALSDRIREVHAAYVARAAAGDRRDD